MALPFGKVGSARRQTFRMKAYAQHVDGRLEQMGRDTRHQGARGRVVRGEMPVPVDRDRRERHMRVEDALHQ